MNEIKITVSGADEVLVNILKRKIGNVLAKRNPSKLVSRKDSCTNRRKKADFPFVVKGICNKTLKAGLKTVVVVLDHRITKAK